MLISELLRVEGLDAGLGLEQRLGVLHPGLDAGQLPPGPLGAGVAHPSRAGDSEIGNGIGISLTQPTDQDETNLQSIWKVEKMLLEETPKFKKTD